MSEQLREEPSPLEAGVVKLGLGAELERKQVPRSWTEQPEPGGLLVRHMLVGYWHGPAQIPSALALVAVNSSSAGRRRPSGMMYS